MLTLVLMRHAKSSWDDPRQQDHDRPLNARGKASAEVLGDWLHSAGHVPKQALVSSARRTIETFDRLHLQCPHQSIQDLYHARADMILTVLRTATQPSVLVVGHNPGIGDFGRRIVANAPDHARFWDYPTGATLVATFNAMDWCDVSWGSGEVSNFVIPRELMDDA